MTFATLIVSTKATSILCLHKGSKPPIYFLTPPFPLRQSVLYTAARVIVFKSDSGDDILLLKTLRSSLSISFRVNWVSYQPPPMSALTSTLNDLIPFYSLPLPLSSGHSGLLVNPRIHQVHVYVHPLLSYLLFTFLLRFPRCTSSLPLDLYSDAIFSERTSLIIWFKTVPCHSSLFMLYFYW